MDKEIKEVTLDELKTLMGESVKEILPELKEEIINEVKSNIDVKVDETDEEKADKASQFIKDVLDNKAEKKAIDSTSGSFGYTVPTELADYILQARDKIAKMRKYAFVFSMAGNFQLPTEGTGITAYWVAENATITASDPTVGKKDLVDYYLATRVLVPRKLLNTSGVNVIRYIGELAARALQSTEETAFVSGDGSSKPTGLRSASVGEVAQAGANLAYDDLVNIFYTLPEQYRDNAVFLTSSAGMKLIRKLKDSNGLPIFDMRDQTIFGKAVIESEDIPANLGTGVNETEIWFGDMWYYWIKDGETLFMDTDKDIDTLQTKIVVAEAVDGVYTLPAACKKLSGVL